MKAICTKVLPMTNTRPRRIKAFDLDGNSVIISAGAGDMHDIAAHALCAKMNWTGQLIGGAIKGGMAFVFVPLSQ